jgi:flagellar biogenesis protein FliO
VKRAALVVAACLTLGAVSAQAAPVTASSASPSWLRADKPVAKHPFELERGPSPLRIGGMLLLVATLGGVAFYARRKRQVLHGGQPKAELKVVGTTRVGPKATAVVLEVGGKRLLLGVTEQAVSTLAWLDDEANAAADEREPSGVAERPRSGARAVDDVVAAGPSGFLKLLRNAVGTAARPGAAVDEVVRTTKDEVRLSSQREQPREPARESDATVAIEGQVMGLAKRRKEST